MTNFHDAANLGWQIGTATTVSCDPLSQVSSETRRLLWCWPIPEERARKYSGAHGRGLGYRYQGIGMENNRDVTVLSGVRTAIGKYGGGLKDQGQGIAAIFEPV
jgi:hypothetical protein